MKKIEILTIESLNRSPLTIEGYLFEGSDPKAASVAIVGAMEGKTVLPLYSASKLVEFLRNEIGNKEKIRGNILIIPSINHYALNLGERFWPLDKTDLNMIFPGYGAGETTQRIAHKVFEALSGYDYGISLETRNDLSSCISYISLLQSGYEDIPSARKCGLRLIHHKEMKPTDTVSLQYNWQLWGTKALSIICPSDTKIETDGYKEIFESMVRFLYAIGSIEYKVMLGYDSNIVYNKGIEIVKTPKSGIFIPTKKTGASVAKEEMIGKIINALEGNVVHRIFAPCDGVITCVYNNGLILENALAFRILKNASA
ncbi:MAG: succinylglutamate desuccinylase/aspartoacylase family protein [Campylobacterales bacterium]|nr:succinylglutamate desuccinylase/aspartoacylase family protein [Campylobacterales bacterium]